MSCALLVFPHQLFEEHPGFKFKPDRIVLIEDPLFFGDPQYPAQFHKQKLWLHRATMAAYQERLKTAGYDVSIEAYDADAGMVGRVIAGLADEGFEKIVVAEMVDDVGKRRVQTAAFAAGIGLEFVRTPGFLNTAHDNKVWGAGRKRWLMAEFYKFQRRRLGILEADGEPVGGQWSFDEANRKKVPKRALETIPGVPILEPSELDQAARTSILSDFPNAPGDLETLYFPTTHEAATAWLDDFLVRRFSEFGIYEDAIVEGESWLWHAVLTPAMNVGLLTPSQVVTAALDYAETAKVPLNSLEGFIRQIIGWREFMRATYEQFGPKMRSSNHWGHHRALPASFYDATTGIDPIDDVISRVLTTGYCHHIERLMVLGGFMFLCEIDPDDVYRWFMEMFVDSYDWVMVPNVYAMSQHADGGLITTKPYFSGSNYIRKMSHWKLDQWSDIWDGLYWRFIWKHRDELANNPRWAMMCRSVERMDTSKREKHLYVAETYLASLG